MSIERISGYEPETGICWRFNNPGDSKTRCKCPACSADYDKHLLAYFGRCRSGQRWFWHAYAFNYASSSKQHVNGYAATEAEAMDAAMAAVRGLSDKLPIMAFVSHGRASDELQKLNAEKRRAKPASNAKGTPLVEYLYSHKRDYNAWDRKSYDYFYRFPITKRTAKRVFYLNKAEPIDEHGEPIVSKYNIHDFTPTEPAFVDRGKLEADGSIWARPARTRLYASWQGLLAERRRIDGSTTKPVDLAALKQAMADAHPDKGGSAAAFIEARAAYVATRRMQRAAR